MTLPTIEPPLGVPLVYLVDDEEVVRDAIAWLLRSRRLLSEGFASAESFEATLPEATDTPQDDWPTGPSCLLLDLRMCGMSGLTLFDRLLQRQLTDALPVIFLTGNGDVATAVAAVKRGAFDFVEKPFSNNALVDRIEGALAASAAALTVRAAQRHTRRRLEQLNDRERQVMQMIAAGSTNREISEAVSLSVRTVENHRAHVFEKLGVGSAVELANLLHGVAR